MIGYQASHEQFDPKSLKDLAILAKKNGFQAILSSDHFHPWSANQGQSGFSWVYMPSVLEATGLPISTVNAPGWRYHPAIIAQAVATLDLMYPDKFTLVLGSGENLNEHIIGEKWPNKNERNTRLLESAEIMRKLWRGEQVTHKGLITLESAKLYTRPKKIPKIFGAAMSPETAKWMAPWVDGLLTVNQTREKVQEVIEAFQKNGGNHKPMYLKVQLSYGSDEEKLLQDTMDEWKMVCIPARLTQDLATPEAFDEVGMLVTEDHVKKQVRISTDLDEHKKWIRDDFDMGFERVYLHNVTRNQEQFIVDFGKKVLPDFKDKP